MFSVSRERGLLWPGPAAQHRFWWPNVADASELASSGVRFAGCWSPAHTDTPQQQSVGEMACEVVRAAVMSTRALHLVRVQPKLSQPLRGASVNINFYSSKPIVKFDRRGSLPMAEAVAGRESPLAVTHHFPS